MDQSSAIYWVFAGVHPRLIGAWMLTVGLIGVASRILAHFWCISNLMITTLIKAFAVGVMLHSAFRTYVLITHGLIGDPLLVLFVCDFFAMLAMMVHLNVIRWRRGYAI